ncbi:MAG: 2-methylcitrate dehydratase, partial [Gammaproteobacteria bacterium]
RTEVEYPVGHRKRRAEGIPLLINKFENSLSGKLSDVQFGKLTTICDNQKELESLPVQDLMALLVSG